MDTCRKKQRYDLERELNREQRTVMHLTIRFTTPVLMSVGRIFRLVTSNCQNRSVPLEGKQGRFSNSEETEVLPSGTEKLEFIFFRCCQAKGDAGTLVLSWTTTNRLFGFNVPDDNSSIILATQRDEKAIRRSEH